MESTTSDTTGTTGTAKDYSLTCYNCSQMGHISRNSPNNNLMKKSLEQALVSKDAPKAKSGCSRKDKNKRCALTSRKGSCRVAEEKEVMQESDSEAESELERLSDLDAESGIVKGGQ